MPSNDLFLNLRLKILEDKCLRTGRSIQILIYCCFIEFWEKSRFLVFDPHGIDFMSNVLLQLEDKGAGDGGGRGMEWELCFHFMRSQTCSYVCNI